MGLRYRRRSRKPKAHGPSSEIKCPVCKGSAKHPTAHPSHNAPCSACFGTGFSSASYDQPCRGQGSYEVPEGATVVDTVMSRFWDRKLNRAVEQVWSIWEMENPDYERRLELDRQGLLYALSFPRTSREASCFSDDPTGSSPQA